MVLHSSLLIVQSSRVHPIADGSRCGKCEQTTVTTSRLVLHVHVLYCDGLPTEKHYICHPRTASSVHCMPAGDALREVVDSFKREYGFPQCAGAVDGTHIPTVSPIECPGDYYNHIVWVFFNAKVIWTWSLKYSGHHLHHSLFVLHVFTPPLLFFPAYFLCLSVSSCWCLANELSAWSKDFSSLPFFCVHCLFRGGPAEVFSWYTWIYEYTWMQGSDHSVLPQAWGRG